jgi:hypothetical protein
MSPGVWLLIIGLVAMLGACYPYDRESTSEYDVIATTFDPNADFSTKLTYAMPDQVRVVSDPDTPPEDVDRVDPSVEAAILDTIADNMADLGYTRLPNNPDGTAPAGAAVHLAPFAAETTWVGGSCYPYYYDYWYGGYGWCYPVYYSYTTGTVVIPMFDTALTEGSEPIWIAGINGIIDSTSSNAARVSGAIDAAFNQSPYLSHN